MREWRERKRDLQMPKPIRISFAIWKATVDGFVSFSPFFSSIFQSFAMRTHARLRKIASGKIHVHRPTPNSSARISMFFFCIAYASPAPALCNSNTYAQRKYVKHSASPTSPDLLLIWLTSLARSHTEMFLFFFVSFIRWFCCFRFSTAKMVLK